jgi:hypothetical protein
MLPSGIVVHCVGESNIDIEAGPVWLPGMPGVPPTIVTPVVIVEKARTLCEAGSPIKIFVPLKASPPGEVIVEPVPVPPTSIGSFPTVTLLGKDSPVVGVRTVVKHLLFVLFEELSVVKSI